MKLKGAGLSDVSEDVRIERQYYNIAPSALG